VPFKEVAFRVKLDEGVLSLDPFAFEMPQGRLSGQARIDARKDIPAVHIDVRIKDIQLEQLKGKKPGASAPLVGLMQARAVIDGNGDSVHQVMSDANGRFTIILPDGQITSAFAELTGINVSKGLGLLLTKSDEKAPIRCGVAQFKIDGRCVRRLLILEGPVGSAGLILVQVHVRPHKRYSGQDHISLEQGQQFEVNLQAIHGRHRSRTLPGRIAQSQSIDDDGRRP
jgi:hypothetical protein